MSVQVYWKPVTDDNRRVEGGSTLIAAMDRLGWKLPREFTAADIPRLEGMYVAGMKGASDILAAIQEHDKILVEAGC